MRLKNFFILLGSICITLLAGFIGSFFNRESIPTWYETINKPFFNPPNWVFAPVWTALFILMGVSLYLVWTSRKKGKIFNIAIGLFAVQLALNILWSFFFFYLQSPFSALIEIIILWFAILFTIIYFFRISKAAGYLLLPYIAWVSFAALLNFAIFLIN